MRSENDVITLARQSVRVVKCEADGCGRLMVNLDADQLAKGDLMTLKREGLRISNPETDKPICISCEYKTVGRRLADWFNEEVEEDDDDDFFSSALGGFIGSSLGSGGSGFGGSFGGGSFGGFGGGGFGGGGASGGF